MSRLVLVLFRSSFVDWQIARLYRYEGHCPRAHTKHFLHLNCSLLHQADDGIAASSRMMRSGESFYAYPRAV